LEIGSARDLGFCKSVKKDGNSCDSWIDNRRTEFCEFHINAELEKTRKARIEISTMNFGYGNSGGKSVNSRDMTGYRERNKKNELGQKTRYDKESHSQIYIGKKSAVKLLDDVDFDPDAFHRGSTKEERVTRHLIAQEKERELARKLGAIGSGQGANYMRSKDLSQQTAHSGDGSTREPVLDAGVAALLSSNPKDVALSPVKRKRANTASSTAAIGWGGHLTKELGRMKNGESLQPVKKKTRFVTEKGIREAGRESFGGEIANTHTGGADGDDDDDDDLDIVR